MAGNRMTTLVAQPRRSAKARLADLDSFGPEKSLIGKAHLEAMTILRRQSPIPYEAFWGRTGHVHSTRCCYSFGALNKVQLLRSYVIGSVRRSNCLRLQLSFQSACAD